MYCTSWVLSSPPVYVALPIFFWRLLAPFTCAAPPSNHHKSCNHNTHFCSTAPHLNRTSWSHYTPKHHSSIWGGGLNSFLNTQGRAHNRTMPKVSRRNPRADSSDEESPQKNHRGAPPPRSLLPPPLWEQRQRQRRPQRAPIPKHPQPQPLSQHHKRDKDGEDGKAWMSGECASWITMGVIFLC